MSKKGVDLPWTGPVWTATLSPRSTHTLRCPIPDSIKSSKQQKQGESSALTQTSTLGSTRPPTRRVVIGRYLHAAWWRGGARIFLHPWCDIAGQPRSNASVGT